MGQKECSQVAKESRAMFFRVMGSPSRVTVPLWRRYPRMHFISVVLPAPFSPNSPTISPGARVRSTPTRASIFPM